MFIHATPSKTVDQLCCFNSLFWEGFPQGFGAWLRGFAPIQRELQPGQLVSLADKTWLTVLAVVSKVLGGPEVRTLCRPIKLLKTKLGKPFLNGPQFEHRSIKFKQGKAVSKLTQLEVHYCLKYYLKP